MAATCHGCDAQLHTCQRPGCQWLAAFHDVLAAMFVLAMVGCVSTPAITSSLIYQRHCQLPLAQHTRLIQKQVNLLSCRLVWLLATLWTHSIDSNNSNHDEQP
jgi:hypothetical protein